MQAYPILHKSLIFQVLTDLDLPFAHIHAILDWLQERDAFPEPGEEGPDPEGETEGLPYRFFEVPTEGARYSVVVLGWEVVVLPEGVRPEGLGE